MVNIGVINNELEKNDKYLHDIDKWQYINNLTIVIFLYEKLILKFVLDFNLVFRSIILKELDF